MACYGINGLKRHTGSLKDVKAFLSQTEQKGRVLERLVEEVVVIDYFLNGQKPTKNSLSRGVKELAFDIGTTLITASKECCLTGIDITALFEAIQESGVQWPVPDMVLAKFGERNLRIYRDILQIRLSMKELEMGAMCRLGLCSLAGTTTTPMATDDGDESDFEDIYAD